MSRREGTGIDADPPRLLHERSEYAYTSSTHEAMSDEPEAISAAEQRQLTARAHRDAERKRVEAWTSVRGALVAAADDIELLARGSNPIGNALRDLRRVVTRIDAALR